MQVADAIGDALDLVADHLRPLPLRSHARPFRDFARFGYIVGWRKGALNR